MIFLLLRGTDDNVQWKIRIVVSDKIYSIAKAEFITKLLYFVFALAKTRHNYSLFVIHYYWGDGNKAF